MYFRILRKDLKRKKSINLILLIFIFLSTMFIAGSLNNFAVILNGVENFMNQSGIGDFLIVTMGGSSGELSENDREIEEFLYTVPNFSISYRIARFNASFRSLSLRNGPARLSLR